MRKKNKIKINSCSKKKSKRKKIIIYSIYAIICTALFVLLFNSVKLIINQTHIHLLVSFEHATYRLNFSYSLDFYGKPNVISNQFINLIIKVNLIEYFSSFDTIIQSPQILSWLANFLTLLFVLKSQTFTLAQPQKDDIQNPIEKDMGKIINGSSKQHSKLSGSIKKKSTKNTINPKSLQVISTISPNSEKIIKVISTTITKAKAGQIKTPSLSEKDAAAISEGRKEAKKLIKRDLLAKLEEQETVGKEAETVDLESQIPALVPNDLSGSINPFMEQNMDHISVGNLGNEPQSASISQNENGYGVGSGAHLVSRNDPGNMNIIFNNFGPISFKFKDTNFETSDDFTSSMNALKNQLGEQFKFKIDANKRNILIEIENNVIMDMIETGEYFKSGSMKNYAKEACYIVINNSSADKLRQNNAIMKNLLELGILDVFKLFPEQKEDSNVCKALCKDQETLKNLLTNGIRFFVDDKTFINLSTTPNMRPTLRCQKCQGYRHKANGCKFSIKCEQCGESGHSVSDCINGEQNNCANCGPGHKTSSKKCPKYKQARELDITDRKNYILFGITKPTTSYEEKQDGFSRNFSLQSDLENINNNYVELADQVEELRENQDHANKLTVEKLNNIESMMQSFPLTLAQNMKSECQLLYNQIDYETDLKLKDHEEKMLNKISRVIGQEIPVTPNKKIEKPERMSNYNRNVQNKNLNTMATQPSTSRTFTNTNLVHKQSNSSEQYTRNSNYRSSYQGNKLNSNNASNGYQK